MQNDQLTGLIIDVLSRFNLSIFDVWS